MEFTFEATGDKLISRRFERFADRSIAAAPAFQKIADNFRGYERRLFDTQGASGGVRWDDLAESTCKAKAARDLDPRVLRATNRLRNSLVLKRSLDHEEEVTDSFLLFGSKLDYAGPHQKGRGVPMRKPLQYTEAQKRRIVKTLQRYIVTGEV